jgi:hypothetical protein
MTKLHLKLLRSHDDVKKLVFKISINNFRQSCLEVLSAWIEWRMSSIVTGSALSALVVAVGGHNTAASAFAHLSIVLPPMLLMAAGLRNHFLQVQERPVLASAPPVLQPRAAYVRK